MDQGQAGDNVGCLLRGIDREDRWSEARCLAAPGTVNPHKVFEGEVYVLKKEEGGRHKPFFTNYRPQFYMRTTDVTGTISLPDDVKMVMPGDNVTMKVELITPVALEEKQRFAIREGGKTVGAGVITKIVGVKGPLSRLRCQVSKERVSDCACLRGVRRKELQTTRSPRGAPSVSADGKAPFPDCRLRNLPQVQAHTVHREARLIGQFVSLTVRFGTVLLSVRGLGA